MNIETPSDSLRKSIQNIIYKFLIISIALSVVIFSIKQQGFFFGIH